MCWDYRCALPRLPWWEVVVLWGLLGSLVSLLPSAGSHSPMQLLPNTFSFLPSLHHIATPPSRMTATVLEGGEGKVGSSQFTEETRCNNKPLRPKAVWRGKGLFVLQVYHGGNSVWERKQRLQKSTALLWLTHPVLLDYPAPPA